MKLLQLLTGVPPTNNATRFLFTEVEKLVKNIFIFWINLYTYPCVQYVAAELCNVVCYEISLQCLTQNFTHLNKVFSCLQHSLVNIV